MKSKKFIREWIEENQEFIDDYKYDNSEMDSGEYDRICTEIEVLKAILK